MPARTARYGYAGDASELARGGDGHAPDLRVTTGVQGVLPHRHGRRDRLVQRLGLGAGRRGSECSRRLVVAENMADELELRETSVGEVVPSTTLGVSSSAAVARS